MAIESRKLEVGTRLVGRYKKQDHFAEVVREEDGSIVYRLDNGQTFKSPSAAGTAVMGGVSCNGWRFWSLAEDAEAKAVEKPKAKQARRIQGKIITPTESQEGVPEGSTRFFCPACLDYFLAEGSEEPESCPAGHRAEPVPMRVEA